MFFQNYEAICTKWITVTNRCLWIYASEVSYKPHKRAAQATAQCLPRAHCARIG